MEALHKFDEELQKLKDYDILMTKIAVYMLAFFGLIFLIFPELDTVVCFMSWEMLMLSLSLYLKSFLYVNIDKKAVSIFNILKYTPISKEIYLKDRYAKLKGFLFKLSKWCIATKILGFLLFKETNIKTITTSFLWLLFMFIMFTLCGILTIKSSTRI